MRVCVESARVSHVAYPLKRTFRSGIHDITHIFSVLVELNAGHSTGIGYAFAFHQADSEGIYSLAKDFAEAVLGRKASEVRTEWARHWARINFAGHGGLPVMAVAAVDMALWDLHAQIAELPLYALLGTSASDWPVYASGGSLELGTEQLVEEAILVRERGFEAFKCRVGSASLADDVSRVGAVREAVGDKFTLMVDANQAWSRIDASRACSELAQFNLAWVEEPLLAEDVYGLARLRARVDVPIAAGETAYGVSGMMELIRADAVDILQPDMMRCGGITSFLSVASVATAHHITVMPHLYSETAVHLMGLLPDRAMIEYLPGWFDHLFGSPAIRSGRLHPGETYGLGLRARTQELASMLIDAIELGR